MFCGELSTEESSDGEFDELHVRVGVIDSTVSGSSSGNGSSNGSDRGARSGLRACVVFEDSSSSGSSSRGLLKIQSAKVGLWTMPRSRAV